MQNVKLTCCGILLFGLSAFNSPAQQLYIKTIDGSQTAYGIEEIRKLRIRPSTVVAYEKNGKITTFSYSNLKCITFSDFNQGQPEQEDSKGIRVYPNPVTDLFQVSYKLPESQNAVIKILSIDGRDMYEQILNSDINICQIDATLFPKGLYLCKITSSEGIRVVKFIKN